MRPTMSRGSPNASLLRAGWVGDTTALLRARQHRAREHRAGVRVADELDGAGWARALAPLGWIRARCYGRAVRAKLDPERGTS